MIATRREVSSGDGSVNISEKLSIIAFYYSAEKDKLCICLELKQTSLTFLNMPKSILCKA